MITTSFIPVYKTLRQHPKLLRLQRSLGIDQPTALGLVVNLWLWATDYAPDGNLSDCTPDDLKDATEWEDDGRVLLARLIQFGFVDETDDGLWLHDWQEYGGKYYAQASSAAPAPKTLKSKRDHVPGLTDAVKERAAGCCEACGRTIRSMKATASDDGGTYLHVDPQEISIDTTLLVCRACHRDPDATLLAYQARASTSKPRPSTEQARTKPLNREEIKTKIREENERGARAKRKSPEHPLPDDFTLTDDRRAYAVKHGIPPAEIDDLFERFQNHARQTDRRCSKWGPAWCNWVLVDKKRRAEIAKLPPQVTPMRRRPGSSEQFGSAADIAAYAEQLQAQEAQS